MERTGSSLLSSFGFVVKERRHELGLSQEELAARSGLHRTYITDIERGARNITLKSAARLAGALGLSLSVIIAKTEARADPLLARFIAEGGVPRSSRR